MFLITEVTINIAKLQIIIKSFVMNSFVRAVQLFEYEKHIPYSSTMYKMVPINDVLIGIWLSDPHFYCSYEQIKLVILTVEFVHCGNTKIIRPYHKLMLHSFCNS